MGNIQNMLDSLSGAKMFTSIDLYSGCWNVSISENDRHRTAYLLPSSAGFPDGLFEFKRSDCQMPQPHSAGLSLDYLVVQSKSFASCKWMISSVILPKSHLKHSDIILVRLGKSGTKTGVEQMRIRRNALLFLVTKFHKMD